MGIIIPSKGQVSYLWQKVIIDDEAYVWVYFIPSESQVSYYWQKVITDDDACLWIFVIWRCFYLLSAFPVSLPWLLDCFHSFQTSFSLCLFYVLIRWISSFFAFDFSLYFVFSYPSKERKAALIRFPIFSEAVESLFFSPMEARERKCNQNAAAFALMQTFFWRLAIIPQRNGQTDRKKCGATRVVHRDVHLGPCNT